MKKDEKLIEKALKEGRELADKIQSAKTISEIDSLSDEYEKYCNFVNENFGILNDYDKRDCEIVAFLSVAFSWKQTLLQSENINNPATQELYEEYMRQYIEYLNSKKWVEESYGKKL